MNSEQLRKLQLTQLYILNEIDRVCKMLDIKYFLDAGSALGAIRHQGFIPWDDDLDIGMTRENYTRLIQEGQSLLPKDLFIQTFESDTAAYTLFAKVRLEGTLMRQPYVNCDNKGHDGVWVDIFPYDHVSKNILIRKVSVLRGTLWRQLHYGKRNWANEGNHAKIVHRVLMPVLRTIPERWLREKAETCRVSNSASESPYFHPYDYEPRMILKYEDIYPLRMTLFEGDYYPVLNNVEKYLALQYGDYMKPPEQDDQKPKHNVDLVLRDDILERFK